MADPFSEIHLLLAALKSPGWSHPDGSSPPDHAPRFRPPPPDGAKLARPLSGRVRPRGLFPTDSTVMPASESTKYDIPQGNERSHDQITKSINAKQKPNAQLRIKKMGMESEEQKKGQSCKMHLLPSEIRDEYREVARSHRRLLERLADR
jgi:hypothetical protein